jgi:hypothetical protein
MRSPSGLSPPPLSLSLSLSLSPPLISVFFLTLSPLSRAELSTKITGEDRRELMELQYQVGRLELENMELEQHRIVHESILKGKDLTIQKLKSETTSTSTFSPSPSLLLPPSPPSSPPVGFNSLSKIKSSRGSV